MKDAIRGRNVELVRLIHSEYMEAINDSKEVEDLKNHRAALKAQQEVLLQIRSKYDERGGQRDFVNADEKRQRLEERVNSVRTSLSFKIERELLRGRRALGISFYHGVMEVVKWILNDLIVDPKIRMKYLNGTITECKPGRKTERSALEIINKILEKDLKENTKFGQQDIGEIRNIFEFLLKHDDVDGVCMILDRLKNDEKTKRMWFKTVDCLEYAGKRAIWSV